MKHSHTGAIADLTSEHGLSILTLNNEHHRETSKLDEASLSALMRMACCARGVNGGSTAFLIALDHAAAYHNPNFEWFKARYSSFIYIDRVIVASAARGQGLAKALYSDVFNAARQRSISHIVCEINADPPNPVSSAFHYALGFRNMGQARIHAGTKTVSYNVKELD